MISASLLSLTRKAPEAQHATVTAFTPIASARYVCQRRPNAAEAIRDSRIGDRRGRPLRLTQKP